MAGGRGFLWIVSEKKRVPFDIQSHSRRAVFRAGFGGRGDGKGICSSSPMFENRFPLFFACFRSQVREVSNAGTHSRKPLSPRGHLKFLPMMGGAGPETQKLRGADQSRKTGPNIAGKPLKISGQTVSKCPDRAVLELLFRSSGRPRGNGEPLEQVGCGRCL